MPQQFDAWLGKEETRTDWTTPTPLRRLAALLDYEVPPWAQNELPPLGHWLFHLPDTRQSDLGSDGHPCKGRFMPPIPFPRRMWAGSRVRFLRNIAIGTELLRHSTLTSIAFKTVTSGEMALVTLQHRIISDGAIAIVEDHDVAYINDRIKTRERTHIAIDVPDAQITRRCQATPELLFRFSALTFNAHRIHYDRDYARSQEHYPGLVVHGPLLAMLLLDHFLRHQPTARLTQFSFRARAPVFDCDPFDLCLALKPAGAHLWVAGADEEVKMTAEIETEQQLLAPEVLR